MAALTVLLMILKILGIMLLSILAFVFLLIFLVLFVPINYRITGSYKDNTLCLKANASWLLRFINVIFDINNDEKLIIKILGIKLKKKEKDSNKKSGSNKNSKKKKLKQKNFDSDTLKENIHTNNEIESNDKVEAVAENKLSEIVIIDNDKQADSSSYNDLENITVSKDFSLTNDISNDDSDNINEDSTKSLDTEKSPKSLDAEKSMKSLDSEESSKSFDKEEFSESLDKEEKNKTSNKKTKSKTADKEQKTNTSGYDKIKNVLEIVQSDDFKKAFLYSKKKIIKLLKLILPRKWYVNAILGFDDPSVTGKIISISSMFYPLIYKHISIKGDFENEIIDVDFYFKGHITIIKILSIGVFTYFNKDIRKIIKSFKEGI